MFADHIDRELLEDPCQEKRCCYTSDLEKPNSFGLYIVICSVYV